MQRSSGKTLEQYEAMARPPMIRPVGRAPESFGDAALMRFEELESDLAERYRRWVERFLAEDDGA